MKIKCTIMELGRIVRDCENGYCASCALRSLCDKYNGKGIECLVEEIEPTQPEPAEAERATEFDPMERTDTQADD